MLQNIQENIETSSLYNGQIDFKVLLAKYGTERKEDIFYKFSHIETKPPIQDSLKFPLEHYPVQVEQYKNNLVQFSPVKQLNDLIFESKEIIALFGRPRCISCSDTLIVVGGSLGSALLYPGQVIVQGGKEVGSLCALVISEDEQVIICGFESGAIGILSVRDRAFMKIFQGLHNSRVLAVRILFKNPTQHHQVSVLSSDERGNIIINRFQKGLFGFSQSTQIVLDKQFYPILCIEILPEQIRRRHFDCSDFNEVDPGSSDEEDIENDPFCKRSRVVAIQNAEHLWVLKIYLIEDYPIEVLFHIGNPQTPDPKVQIYNRICWGEGTLQEKEDKLILSVSWGNLLYFIQVNETLKLSEPIDVSLEANDQLWYMTFLSKSLMLLYTQQGVIILHISHLKQEDEKLNIKNTYHLFYPRKSDVNTQLYVIGVEEEGEVHEYFQQHTLGTFAHAQNFAQVFCLGEDGNSILEVRMSNWENVVQSLLDQGEWKKGMSLLVQINQNQPMYIPQLDNGEDKVSFSQKIHATATRYLQLIMKQIEQKQILNDTLIILLEFLIGTGEEKYMFQIVLQVLQDKFKDIAFFAEALKSFIIGRKIHFIPQDPLEQLVSYYNKQNNIKIIEDLIISLDQKMYQESLLLSLAVEYRLTKAIIYLYNHDGDFVMPLMRLWSQALRSRQTPENIGEAAYYTRKCIKQREFGGARITDSKVITQFIEFMLETTFLNVLIEYSIEMFFIIMGDFFSPLNEESVKSNFVCHNKNDAVQINKIAVDYLKTLDTSQEKRFLLVVMSYQNQLTKISQQKLPEDEKKKNIQQAEMLFSIFVLKVYLFNIVTSFHAKKLQSCLKIIIENDSSCKYLNLCDFINILPIKQKNYYSVNLQEWPNHIEVLDYLYQYWLIECFKKLEQQDETLYKAFVIEQSYSVPGATLSILAAYLQYQSGQISKSLQYYLQSQSLLIKQSVFEWLFDTLKDLQRKVHSNKQMLDTLNILKTAAISKLSSLVQISAQSTREIVSHFIKGQQTIIIDSLSATPELQLEYLDNLLKNEDIPEEQLLKLQALHIRLLTILKPTKVLEVLKSRNYPIDESLQETRALGIHEASAYLLERAGSIDEAANELFIQIEETFANYIQFKFNVQLPPLQLLRPDGKKQEQIELSDVKLKVDNSLEQLKALLIRNKNHHHEQAETEWYSLLMKIFKVQQFTDALIRKLGQKRDLKRISDYLDIKLEALLEEIAIQTSKVTFVNQIVTKYTELSLGKMKRVFMNLLFTAEYQINTLSVTKDMQEQSMRFIGDELAELVTHGVYAIPVCQKCNQVLNEVTAIEFSDITVFYCGHVYHSNCIGKKNIIRGARLCPQCINHLKNLITLLGQNKQNTNIKNLIQQDMQKPKGEPVVNIVQAKQPIFSVNIDKIDTKIRNQTLLADFDRQRSDKYLIKQL